MECLKEMIYESSRDYFDDTVILMFEGERPTHQEIHDHVRQNYVHDGQIVEITNEENFRGLINPGCVLVKLNIIH